MSPPVFLLRVLLLLLGGLLATQVALAGPEAASEAAARAAVEKHRDDAHRERVRVDWAQFDDEVPPDGAEMTRIKGYIDYEVTRIVLRGAKAEGRSVFMGRKWFYGSDERFTARSFDVSPEAFAAAWNAARRVEAAEAVRLDAPERTNGSMMVATHAPYRCVRLRSAADLAPWHVSVCRGASKRGGVRVWDEIRSEAMFDLVTELIPPTERCTSADFDEWAPWLLAEVVRGEPEPLAKLNRPQRLVIETSLRGLGEVGTKPALAAVDALEARLRAPTGPTSAADDDLLDECRLARTKLRLRHAFDATDAAALLSAPGDAAGWDTDLRAWVRRRWRAADPAGFLTYARGRIADPASGPERLVECLEDLAPYADPELVPIVRSFLSHPRLGVRAAAAAACLVRDRKDDAALVVLVRAQLAQPRLFETDDALRTAIRSGVEDGRWVHLALASADRLGFERDEQVRIWRAMLDRPPHRGTHWAVRHLLHLEDRATYAKLETVTARWAAEAPARETVGLSEDAAASMAWFVRAARARKAE